ncbi:hypothetical protein [Streptomyces sp. BBFR102]|uniref:hypothetical protein n=1 Tax=Streptomyces sp. BBFR102 TaxID=3448171 RepID=UPI003F52B7D9
MICGICSKPATHYFATARGNQGRCQRHADQFGYPEYLVELTPPKPALRQPGYVIQFWDGSGEGDAVAEVWPFPEELAEWWVQNISGCDSFSAERLVEDAAYRPYEPHLMETAGVQVEVTRVTLLTLA